jgi:hypothetical protein
MEKIEIRIIRDFDPDKLKLISLTVNEKIVDNYKGLFGIFCMEKR